MFEEIKNMLAEQLGVSADSINEETSLSPPRTLRR